MVLVKRLRGDEIHCDLCSSRIPNKTDIKPNIHKCLSCNRDVCYRCKITLSYKTRNKSKNHVQKVCGVLCFDCCRDKSIEILDDLGNKLIH